MGWSVHTGALERRLLGRGARGGRARAVAVRLTFRRTCRLALLSTPTWAFAPSLDAVSSKPSAALCPELPHSTGFCRTDRHDARA
jgi:hypothetical protein